MGTMVVKDLFGTSGAIGVNRGMKMIRRLLLPGAILAVLFCQTAFGLGLGKLELNSALNQEFSAEIALTNSSELAVEEILASLASQEDFDRIGVDRNYRLADLHFKVVEIANGSKVIRISSTRSIVEPFLNFIVEILWPSGRVLREYTVLLDPPVFGQQGIAPVSPGVSAPVQSPQDSPEPAARRSVPPVPAGKPERLVTSTVPLGMQEGDIDDGEYGMTGAGDTLWKIATKVRPDTSVSIQQTMLALQRANPDAFINSNINLLKAGYRLRIPSRSEMQRETVSEAVAEVRIQNEEFQDYKGNRVAQLDATRRKTRTNRSSSSTPDEGELRLLASDGSSGQRAGDSDSDARNEALKSELAVAREDLDRAKRANATLNVRMKDLAEQVETLNALARVQSDELAALRAEIQKSLAAVPKVTTVTPRAPDTASPLASLLSNPFVLGVLALLLIGGVVGGMIILRRRQEAASFDDEFVEVELSDDQSELVEVQEEEEPEEELLEEELSPQTGDVISEVEIYIAYGRFPQAVKFLTNAIEAEPDRTDIQLKLLEVYVQIEDTEAFNLQLEALKLLGDEDATAQAAELQSKLQGAPEAAEIDFGEVEASEEIEIGADDAADDEDDDLSFDLDDLDSETDDDTLDLGDELDLDDTGEPELDLDLDAELEPGTSEESTEEDDEFDLELDLDADLDLDDDSLEVNLGDANSPGPDDDDGAITLDLDADDNFNLDDGIELDLGDDDDLELDLGDLDDISLEEDASTKLDLARAYLDMGDNDGVRSLLEEVISGGSESDIKEANELMEKLD